MEEIDAEDFAGQFDDDPGSARHLRERPGLLESLYALCLLVVAGVFALTIGYLPIAGFVFYLCRGDGISRRKSLIFGLTWPLVVPVSLHANFPSGEEPSLITRTCGRFYGRLFGDDM